MSGHDKEAALQVIVVSDPGGGRTSELEQTFREHQGRVFAAAYRITGNAADAEDVLQTVFLRLARREALPQDNLASYLYRAAVNGGLDLLRSRKRAAEEDVGDTPLLSGADSPDRSYEARQLRERLRRALAALPPRAAEVFALRYLEDRDNHEIARMLGLSRVTVAVTLHRARKQLRRMFRAWAGLGGGS